MKERSEHSVPSWWYQNSLRFQQKAAGCDQDCQRMEKIFFIDTLCTVSWSCLNGACSVSSYSFLQIAFVVSKGRVTQREGQTHIEITPWHFDSPCNINSQACPRPKPRARNCIWISQVHAFFHNFCTLFTFIFFSLIHFFIRRGSFLTLSAIPLFFFPLTCPILDQQYSLLVAVRILIICYFNVS